MREVGRPLLAIHSVMGSSLLQEELSRLRLDEEELKCPVCFEPETKEIFSPRPAVITSTWTACLMSDSDVWANSVARRVARALRRALSILNRRRRRTAIFFYLFLCHLNYGGVL